MMVIVDTNEKSTAPKVFASIKKHFSQVIVANLTAGDINIPLDDGGVLCIERKTPADFLGSIADGRIFEQVEAMSSIAKYSAFIVTGYFTYGDKSDAVFIDGEKTNWKGRAVRAVMTLIQYANCALIFCPPSQFCNQIAELYSTVNKPEERSGFRKKRIVTFPPLDERVEILCGFPGLGVKLAESLLTFAGMMEGEADELGFGSLASALRWATIMGIIDKNDRPAGWGAAKIMAFRKMLGLKSNEYIDLNSEPIKGGE